MTDCRNAPNENRTWESFRPYDHQGLHEFFEAKRAENPIFFDEGTGHWIVTTRDLAREIFADPARFSAANVHDPLKPYPKELVDYLTQSGFRRDKTQANCDAPKHTRIRKFAASDGSAASRSHWARFCISICNVLPIAFVVVS